MKINTRANTVHSVQAMSERERSFLLLTLQKGSNSHSHIIDTRKSISVFLLRSDISEMQLNCVNSVDEVICSVGAVCYSSLGKFVSPLISPDRHIQSSQLN